MTESGHWITAVILPSVNCVTGIHVTRLANSFNVFIIHSPPLLSWVSLMIPTSANSQQTRRTGRCRMMRVESSFSRCSRASADNAARDGELSEEDREDTSTGVNVLGNLRCNDEIILQVEFVSIPSYMVSHGRPAKNTMAYLYGTPYVLLGLAPGHTFHSSASNLVNIFLQR